MAGRKFGKTKLAVYKCLKAAERACSVIWYVAPTFQQAEDIAWREFLDYVPPQLLKRINSQKLMLEWVNGSIIQLKGADKEGRLRGPKLNFVVLDEAQDLKPNVWEEEIRPNLLQTQGGALFIGTPSGRNWFWRLWDNAKKTDGWSSFHFTSWDNPYISKDEREMIESGTSGNILKQEYLAEADSRSGVVFSEFDNKLHVVESLVYENGRVYVGIDWGLHNPTCVLWALENKDGSLTIFKEHYQSGLTVEKQAAIIKEQSRGLDINWYAIDPSTCKRDPATMQSIQSTFAREGIHTVPGDNRGMYGIEVIKRFFDQNKVKITTDCKNLIRELLALEWKHTNAGFQEDHVRTDDHAVDSFRYLLTRYYAFNPFGVVVSDKERMNPESQFFAGPRLTIPGRGIYIPKDIQEVYYSNGNY